MAQIVEPDAMKASPTSYLLAGVSDRIWEHRGAVDAAEHEVLIGQTDTYHGSVGLSSLLRPLVER